MTVTATSGWQIIDALGSLIGGIGTTAVVAISAFLLFRERHDRARDARDRREEQARRIGIVATEVLGAAGEVPTDGSAMEIVNRLRVVNRSTEAVSEVATYFRLVDKRKGRFQEVEDRKSRVHPLLPAGEDLIEQQSGILRWDPETRGAPDRTLIGAVTFLDAQGRRWTRWLDNRLEEGDKTPTLEP